MRPLRDYEGREDSEGSWGGQARPAPSQAVPIAQV